MMLAKGMIDYAGGDLVILITTEYPLTFASEDN